jgi:hypothetical protein
VVSCVAGDVADSAMALAFDVFGTGVHRRGLTLFEGQLLTTAKGDNVDLTEFVDSWGFGHTPAMNSVQIGELDNSVEDYNDLTRQLEANNVRD